MEAEFRLEDYIGLAKSTIYRATGIGPRHADYDDMLQCSLLAIWKAYPKFDPARAESFKGLAGCAAANAAIQYRRTVGRRPVSLPLEVEPMSEVARVGIDVAEVWRYLDAVAEPEERKLLKLIYREGMTRRDAAKVMGRSKAWATVRLQNLFRQIRESANPELPRRI